MSTLAPRDQWRALCASDRRTWLWRAWRAHLQKRWPWWLAATVPVILFQGLFMLSFSVVTDSLPHRAYLVLKFDREPVRGGYYAFRFPGAGPYPADAPFVKEFAGVPGDVVHREGRAFFIEGRPVGVAKERAKAGFPLALGPVGPVPPHMYYVHAPHPDSLDSRYAMVGLIARPRVIGRAVPIW